MAYDRSKDPTYNLAVKGRIHFVNKEANIDVKIKKDIIDLSFITYNELKKYDKKKIGAWNLALAEFLRSIRENATDQERDLYPIVEAFATLGIMIIPYFVTFTNNNSDPPMLSYLMILPPYQSVRWDDYNKEDVIGKEAASKLSITPARTPLTVFNSNLDARINPAILKGAIQTGDSLRNAIKANLNYIINKVITDEEERKLYVPVFCYDLDSTTGAFDLESVLFYISKSIAEPLRQGFGVVLKPTKSQFKEILKENRKTTSDSESIFPEPLTVLYLKPIPHTRMNLKSTRAYVSRVVTNANLGKASPDLIKNQQCAFGECKVNSDGFAAGFILHGMNETSNKKEVIDLNCNASNAEEKGIEFGVAKREGETNDELCGRVKEAIIAQFQHKSGNRVVSFK